MTKQNSKIRNYRDLDIWKLGMQIAEETYSLVRCFPKEEVFVLSAQARRAAVSIPSNIAEGFNRFHNPEYRQFLFIALGSCAELETQMELGFRLGYVKESQLLALLEKLNHETRMIRSLIKKL